MVYDEPVNTFVAMFIGSPAMSMFRGKVQVEDGHASFLGPAMRVPLPGRLRAALADHDGPVIASTDYVRAFAEQIRSLVPRRYVVLGTDGFGRSDTRAKLRHFFEVDRHWVTLAALKALADEGAISRDKVAEAIKKYNLDPNKPNPMSV